MSELAPAKNLPTLLPLRSWALVPVVPQSSPPSRTLPSRRGKYAPNAQRISEPRNKLPDSPPILPYGRQCGPMLPLRKNLPKSISLATYSEPLVAPSLANAPRLPVGVNSAPPRPNLRNSFEVSHVL